MKPKIELLQGPLDGVIIPDRPDINKFKVPQLHSTRVHQYDRIPDRPGYAIYIKTFDQSHTAIVKPHR